jgi:hypothetical protein
LGDESSPNEQRFNVLSHCKRKFLLLTTNQTQQSSSFSSMSNLRLIEITYKDLLI